MRILVITNLYPPHVMGGHEIMCSRVSGELGRRGHEIRVLTSRSLSSESSDEAVRELDVVYPDWQRRWTPGNLAKRYRVQSHNYKVTREAISEFEPDLAYAWGMGNITLAPALAAQDSGLPVVFDNGDPALLRQWPSSFKRRAALSLMRLVPRRRMGLDELRLEHGTFVSESLKVEFLAAGLDVADWPVFYRGIPADSVRRRRIDSGQKTRRLLYAGRLHPEKGVDFAIAAVADLVAGKGRSCAHLTIAGDGAPKYVEALKRQARELEIEDCTDFIGRVAPDRMTTLYDEKDIMIFPSVWAEPLSIARLEAMARGLVLVSTETGGGREVLRHEENALVVPAGDAGAIADSVMRLVEDPGLMQRLSDGAVDTIERRFIFEDIVSKIEAYLLLAAKDAALPEGRLGKRAAAGLP